MDEGVRNKHLVDNGDDHNMTSTPQIPHTEFSLMGDIRQDGSEGNPEVGFECIIKKG